MLKRLMRRPLTADSQDTSVGSKVLYVAGAAFLVLGTFKMTSLEITESQLVLGLLATIGVSMQIIVIGMLLEIRGRFRRMVENQR